VNVQPDPEITTQEIVDAVRRMTPGRAVRVRKRTKFRPMAGATGSYFERVQLELDRHKVPAILKLGRLTNGPPTREALFFARHRSEVPLRTALCYGVGASRHGADAWVLMEQLPRGKLLVDWTLEETRDALRNLAVLHARFLDAAPADMPRPFSDEVEATLAAAREGVVGLRTIFDEFPRLLRFASDAALDLADALASRAALFQRAFAASPHTLLHGDYHRGNLIARDGHEQVAFDWQFVCAGPPAYDLAVFWAYLGIVTKPGFLRFFDRMEVQERSLSWADVTDTYARALVAERPSADVSAILSCTDEACAWEVLRQVTYMAGGMRATYGRELAFVYRDHPRLGGPIARWLGIEHIWRMYAGMFGEFEETARRLLARSG
jgi:thiamine kinase-like enzyme